MILTCWHVVPAIGRDQLHVRGEVAEVISADGDDTLDLAVRKHRAIPTETPPKPVALGGSARECQAMMIHGYGPGGRTLTGRLADLSRWPHATQADVRYHDCYLDDNGADF